MQSIKPTKLEYQNALLKIKESGRDKIGLFGEALGFGIGTVGGIGLAGTVASVAGASTLLGSTTLASILGGVFVTATPVGWVVGAAATAGSLVAVCGIIGFVGLVAPHMARILVGPDHRYVFPLSAMLGAILLTAGDLIARTAVRPAELPIGILTALIGAPFFLWLLRQRRRSTQ